MVHNNIIAITTEAAMGVMARIGTAFPKIVLNTVNGEHLVLPNQLGGRYGVVLFYRGHW